MEHFSVGCKLELHNLKFGINLSSLTGEIKTLTSDQLMPVQSTLTFDQFTKVASSCDRALANFLEHIVDLLSSSQCRLDSVGKQHRRPADDADAGLPRQEPQCRQRPQQWKGRS